MRRARGRAPSSTKPPAPGRPFAAAVLGVLATEPFAALTARDIADRLGADVSRVSVSSALLALRARGHAQELGAGIWWATPEGRARAREEAAQGELFKEVDRS